MYLHHQSMLPYCYYDVRKQKIVIKLVTDGKVKAVKLIYGDPFHYQKVDELNDEGYPIWEWVTMEAPMRPKYAAKKEIIWEASLDPLPTRRKKYLFGVTNKKGKEIIFGENGVGEKRGYFFFPFIHEVDAVKTPAWAEEMIWYQIFPERFCNGNPDISPEEVEDWETGVPKPRNFFGGDLQGIIDKLPYLQELGVTGLYMTPIFHSPSNHKYDIQDYFAVDPHFGDIETLKTLVKEAHAKGMKVMLDAVFNHIGGQHPFWLDVLENQEQSKYRDYFHIHSFPVQAQYEDRSKLNFHTFAFVPSMPKWNTENPEARKYLIDSALYWIKECDIDGWRLDVSDEVSFSFWREMRAAIAAVKPDVFIMGEVMHDPSKWLNGQYFDAVMNYPVGNLICDFFLAKKMEPDTFAHKLVLRLKRLSDIHSRVQYNLLDSHDTVRALTKAKGDKLAMKNAFMFMFLMKGAPSIYYGTEVGMEGGGDPGSRGPMVWNPKKQDAKLAAFFKQLIALRKKYNDLIQEADISFTCKKGLCRWKIGKGQDALAFVYNAGKKPVKVKGEILLAADAKAKGVLPPLAAAVFRVSPKR